MSNEKKKLFSEKSSITARGFRHRTTVPKMIYSALELKDKDELLWIYWSDGTVTIKKI